LSAGWFFREGLRDAVDQNRIEITVGK
jgi:hypothetical protein